VAPAEQGTDDEPDLLALAAHHELDVVEQPLNELRRSDQLRARLDLVSDDLAQALRLLLGRTGRTCVLKGRPGSTDTKAMLSSTVLAAAAAALFACWASISGWVLLDRLAHERTRRQYWLDVDEFAAGQLDLGALPRRRLRRLALGPNRTVAADAAHLLVRQGRVPEGGPSLDELTVLVRGGSAEAVSLLKQAIDEHGPSTAGSLLRLTGELDAQAADALLLELLVDGRHPRARTATELEPRASRLHEELIALTTHTESNLRFWAITLLATEGRDPAVAIAVAARADDDDPSVRAAVAEALGAAEAALAKPLLRRLLHDDVFFVRSHAARGAGTLGDGSLAAELLPLLGDENWWVRAASKESLLMLGNDGLDVALTALSHPDRFARDGALEVIAGSARMQDLIVAAEDGDTAAGAAVQAMYRRTANSTIEFAPLAPETETSAPRPRQAALA
jgi:hypothetical protein